MKPLVNYCRWNEAKLRLRGRDENFILGQLVYYTDGEKELVRDFKFEIATATLTISDDVGTQTILLDDMGVPREE